MANQKEQFCADSFDQFIASHLQIKEKKWESVPKGQDPPDFFLMLDQTTFAVEITSTEVMRDVSIGEGQIQEKTYEHTHTRFIKGIENIARESGILKGAYAISFHRPMAYSRFRQIRRDIQGQLLQYIKRTQNMPTSPSEIVRYNGQRVCYISKLHNQRDAVYKTFSDAAWVGSPEVTGIVRGSLQAAVTEKKRKFLAKGETNPRILLLPKVLLFLNTYAFANRTMYFNCIQRIHSLEFFHSVFVIWGNGSCSLLYTGDETWAKAFH